ncbi:hypothetical protein M0812_28459 [Anaeramoeba flamelloides]|uniref:MULE transposase domain-containing protein n=1 Tax=Anaeramoeba flamelloides TaxID=1746091 RepID=A0AAV7Y871_9EUKA|nr:hypothetical protein M0812_28459 [Anaeramoeba flamelloides]
MECIQPSSEISNEDPNNFDCETNISALEWNKDPLHKGNNIEENQNSKRLKQRKKMKKILLKNFKSKLNDDGFPIRIVLSGYPFHLRRVDRDHQGKPTKLRYYCKHYRCKRCNCKFIALSPFETFETPDLQHSNFCKQIKEQQFNIISYEIVSKVIDQLEKPHMSTQKILIKLQRLFKELSDNEKCITYPTKTNLLKIIKESRCLKSQYDSSDVLRIKRTLDETDNLLQIYQMVPEQMIIYSSRRLLNYLKTSQRIYIDGTFKVSPKGAYQILIVMGYLPNIDETKPLCWVLLKSKKQEEYIRCFQNLRSLCTNWNPNYSSSDYKKSLHNALVYCFPNAYKIGCWFHFKQCLKRNVNKYNPSTKDSTNKQILTAIGNLAIYDPETVIEQFLDTVKRYPEFDKFFKYFGRNFLKKWDIKFWNVKYLPKESRTNNPLESYNGKIAKQIGQKRPLLDVAKGLQEEEQYIYGEIERKHRIQIVKRNK